LRQNAIFIRVICGQEGCALARLPRRRLHALKIIATAHSYYSKNAWSVTGGT
jgi:hypothetical protein